MGSEVISTSVYIIVLLLLGVGSIYTVKQKTAVIIERLGKFQTVSTAGLRFKIPIIDRKVGTVNLRVMELPVEGIVNVFMKPSLDPPS